MRSPWDGPSHARRGSDYFPSTPHSDALHSPIVGSGSGRGQNPITAGAAATSLTRMVQDAALRTGHAVTGATLLNSAATPSHSAGSLRGAGESPSDRSAMGKDSPLVEHSEESQDNQYTPGCQHTNFPPNVPHTCGPPSVTSQSGSSKRGKRRFNVPPLPPQPAVERLVAAYVDFVGVTAPMIHIPTLGKQIQRMREGTDVDESDVFVVMMVLALSTMASSRFVDPPDELRACSEAFHAEALKHLDAVFEAQSYIGLQAILLLVWYSLLNPDKGSIWFLVGLASRTCVDLGFHNEHNSQAEKLDNLEIDMRRRLFWVTYKMDRLLSQSLGRPPSIPDGFMYVPLPALQHDVDIHAGQYGAPTGDVCAYKTVFMHTIKLRQLQSEILNHTYGVNGQPLPKEEWFDDMFERLKHWLANAPEPRGTVSSEGYAISFHNSCLLLYRPSRGNPKPGRTALSTVLASSSYIIRIYRRMQLNNRISWLWMTSHFSFMAGLSFLYAFFNLYSHGGGNNVPSLDEAMMDIESCLAVLEYLSPRVPSAGQCHETMRSVSTAILEQLSKVKPNRNDLPTRSPGARFGAAISSARDDPLPSDASFPAPLPPTQLPYELTLLDNLFLNPITSHHKLSEYTNGVKKRKLDDGAAQPTPTQQPASLPPSAFHSVGPYGIAAQVTSAATKNNGLSLASAAGAWLGTEAGQNASSTVIPGQPSGHAGAILDEMVINGVGHEHQQNGQGALQNGSTDQQQQQQQPQQQQQQQQQTQGQQQQGQDQSAFDIFSFLMDEDSGLGQLTTNWNALDVPPDYPLWS